MLLRNAAECHWFGGHANQSKRQVGQAQRTDSYNRSLRVRLLVMYIQMIVGIEAMPMHCLRALYEVPDDS